MLEGKTDLVVSWRPLGILFWGLGGIRGCLGGVLRRLGGVWTRFEASSGVHGGVQERPKRVPRIILERLQGFQMRGNEKYKQ